MAALTPLAWLYKVTWKGHLGAEEIFVYSRWATSASQHDQESIADNYTGDVTDMLATAVTLGGVPTLAQAFPDYVGWDELKVSPWDLATGKLEVGQAPAYRPLTNVGTGATSSGLPYQTALAVSTRSSLPGRRKYNRFYLPTLTVQATDGKGLLGPEEANAFVLWAHLNLVAHSVDAAFPTVLVNANSGSPMTTHAIVDFYLGRRLDTIRKRRNKAPEPRVIDAL